MADSPPRSRSVSPTPSWYPDATANGMSLWDTDTFKVHIGDSILREMWNDRRNADFEIRCGTEKFKEALSGVLTLEAHPYKGNIDNLGDGDDPEIVGEMIHYFYHLELSPKANAFMPRESRDVHGEPSLIYLARIYVLAEKFFCEGLKAKVMSGLRESLEREISQSELAEACRIIFKKTVEPAGERGLKTTVAKCLADELEKIKISESHDDLLQEIPELAFLVLKEIPKPYNGRSRGNFCCNCGRVVQSW
ncbi:hypothetical protein D6C77_06033 [Aureobasidium pullulans]|uniref:BTB domain-containing protein n=1 Tax=Aureobasidium pullulans TaxID=5580 RepID=A0AB74JPD0_AURPU|nr:hypothetical protein D6D12_06974 [Aureobasidium pullulans]THX31988.1 hypothetical protein D6D11_09873 [Aureobasidium pullulans]TIA57640.1 hypothetical protein D6C77_06033 [Aureobasidium pullulans]